MSDLLISINALDGTTSQWLVPTTVRRLDGDIVKQIDVTTNAGPERVSVGSGTYLAEAYLPSGELLRGSTTVGDTGETSIRLLLSPSPHEWLQTSARMTSTVRLTSRPAMPAAVDFPPGARTRAARVPHIFSALRVWLEDPRNVQLRSPILPQPLVPSYSDMLVERFDFGPPGAFTGGPVGSGILFISRHFTTWYAVALPFGWVTIDNLGEAHFEVVINRSTGAITTVVQDQRFGPVLGYLADGQSALAARVLDRQAMELLAEKLMNPFAAAAGGYVLVQRALAGIETSPQWRNWIRNLSNWFPTLPDGWILRGTLLLNGLLANDAADDSSSAAHECFRRAITLGVPLFAGGVRLLLTGMMTLAEDDAAIAWVRRLSLHVEPHQPFTTLRVEEPQ